MIVFATCTPLRQTADQCISLQRWPGNQATQEFEEKLRTPSEHKEKR